MQEVNDSAPDTETMSASPQSLKPNGKKEAKRASRKNSRSIPVLDNSAIADSQQSENMNGKGPDSENAGSCSNEAYFRMLYNTTSRRRPTKHGVKSRDQVKRGALYIIIIVSYALNIRS